MKLPVLLIVAVAAAHAQPGATVAGSVIDAATFKPIAAAYVTLESPTDSYVAQTDAKGHFQMPGVIAGSYVINPQREGFAPAVRHPIHLTVDTAAPPRLELRLMPLGAISGRITDPDGDPVPHALVEALRYTYPNGKKELTAIGKATADDRGEYRIATLPPGRYYVRAALYFSSLDSYFSTMPIRGAKPPLTFVPVFVPGAVDVANAVQLDLPPGGDLPGTNVQLRPDERHAIRATVTAPGEVRIMISCWPTAPRPSLFGMMGGSGAASSRSQTFTNNVPGTYIVEAYDEKRTLHARKTVEVTTADVDVALSLAPAIKIYGAVLVEGNKPLSRAAMRVMLEAADAWDSLAASVAADGTFTLPPGQPIPYGVRVSNPAGGYLKSIYQGAKALTAPRIDPGRSTAPLSITIGTDVATLAGVVVDSRGQPVEGAAVVLVPTGDLADWPDLVRSTAAGPEGRYQLGSIAPGTYRILAWGDAEPGAPLDADFRAPFEKFGVSVTVKAGENPPLQITAVN
jgi:protocatechuate 3,4-dioxygenase beta subunit